MFVLVIPFLPMAESRLCRELERSGVIDPDNFELCRIDDAPIQEIASENAWRP